MTQQSSQTAEAPLGWTIGQVRERARQLGARALEVLTVCADAWTVAGLYEDLSRLSDAELERRGIPRRELHRCIFEALVGPASRF